MSSHSLPTRPARLSTFGACTATLLCLVSTPAYAVLLSPCRASDSQLACRLRSVLDVLEVMAWILGLLLLVAALSAVRAFRRKQKKLRPEDIAPDAQ